MDSIACVQNGDDVKLHCATARSRTTQSRVAAIAKLPVHDVTRTARPRGTDERRRVSIFDISVARRPIRNGAPFESRRALLRDLKLSPLAHVQEVTGDNPGSTHAARGGRRIAKLRTSPMNTAARLTAPGDEMRGFAGARGRRIHGSLGQPCRFRRAARGLLR